MTRSLMFGLALAGMLALQGCTLFYDAYYVDRGFEVNEYGLLGHPFAHVAPAGGPYGLFPIMRTINIRTQEHPPIGS